MRRRAPAQGRGVGAVATGVDSHSLRQPLGVVRRHHAVQLPRDGPDVDVPARARVRQRVHPQAEREGPVRVAADGRVARRGGPARRRVQRRPRRQGGRRRAAHAPGRRVGLVRRLDADRPLHLRDRDVARQARAGARRREEPRRRDARRRRRHRRRRDRLRRLRLGRPALHGDLRRRRRRPGGRRARRGAGGARRRRQGRPGRRGGQRDGPARHRRRARPRARRDRGRRRRGRRAAPRRPRGWRSTATRTASGSARRCSTT